MNGFVNTGDVLRTSLSSQPSLKIYRRNYSSGAIVNFGGNKAAGFAGGTVSNYLVFYSNGSSSSGTTTTGCGLESKFDESTMAVGAYLYTDRNYYFTGGVPDWMLGRTLIQTPNDELNNKRIQWIRNALQIRSVSGCMCSLTAGHLRYPVG